MEECLFFRHDRAVRRLEGLRGTADPPALEAALTRARRRLAESRGEVRGPPLVRGMKKGDVANFVGPVEIRQAEAGVHAEAGGWGEVCVLMYLEGL